MLLSNMKIRSRRLYHPLENQSDIRKILPQEEIDLILIKIRNDSLTNDERDELIKSYIFLVLQIAGRYANLKPWLGDDLVSAGLEGIVYGINKSKEQLVDNNLSAWVTANIHRFITKTFLNDEMIGLRSSSMKDRLKKMGIKPRKLIQQELKEEIKSNTLDLTLLEMKDEIVSSAKDAIDRFIIDMKIKGFGDTEIATFLECSQSSVSKRRANIEERYIKIKNKP